MYRKGKKDIFWHWEEDCENFPSDPSEIVETSVASITENLCPECHKIQKEKNKGKLPPIGVVDGRVY